MNKITTQLSKLEELKRMMVDYLRIKGVVASYEETYNTLIPKILTILQVQGDLTLGTKEITQDGNYFPINDGIDAYSSVSVNIMKDNNALVKFLNEKLGTANLAKRIEVKGNLPDYAYNQRSDVREVYLDGCEELGMNSLNSCNNLKILTSNSVIKRLGQYALASCGNAEGEIILDDNITEIPMYCFQMDYKLRLNLPKSLEFVRISGCRACSELTATELPVNLKIVENYGFYNCPKITASKMPKTLTTIGSYAFAYSGVQFDEITENVILNTYSFNYCDGLINLKFNNSGVIPNYCFQKCSNLESIDIGTGITSINTNCFRGCSKLKKIICRNTTPPTLIYNAINSCPIEKIYVPAEAVETYKSATNWSTYADKIYAIEEM